mmetsp:Transcript_42496/g.109727  ORF Transcript_42496/g.109727 Transcript_42496/m.109727 type:complete len:774 (+) Transcript_42496:79-2400(+)
MVRGTPRGATRGCGSTGSAQPTARAARRNDPLRNSALAHDARNLLAAHHGHRLGESGVDANGVVELGLRHAQLHGQRHGLGDLTGVGAEDVEADDPAALGVNQQLEEGVGGAVLDHRPLQRLRLLRDHVEVGTVLLPGLLLGEADHAVLQRREDGRGDLGVVHGLQVALEEAAHDLLASHLGHGRQLGPVSDQVADAEDVGHIRLLAGGVHLAVVLAVRDAGVVQAKLLSLALAAHCQEHGVELLRDLDAVLALPEGLDLLGGPRLEPGWRGAADELGAQFHHIRVDLVDALAVKAAQEHGAHHDGGVVAQAGQEAGALQRDVRRADHERLARGFLQPEEVVRRDAMLCGAGVASVVRAAARRQHDVLGRRRRLAARAVSQLDGVTVLQRRVGVVVLDVVGQEAVQHALVQRLLNVALYALGHGAPVVLELHLAAVDGGPAVAREVVRVLAHGGGDVHQLLGDAAHVDAGAADAPRRAMWRGLDEVRTGHADAVDLRRLKRRRAAAGAAAEHEEVEVVGGGGQIRLLVQRAGLLQPAPQLGLLVERDRVVAAAHEMLIDENLRYGPLARDLLQGADEVLLVAAVVRLYDLHVHHAVLAQRQTDLPAERAPRLGEDHDLVVVDRVLELALQLGLLLVLRQAGRHGALADAAELALLLQCHDVVATANELAPREDLRHAPSADLVLEIVLVGGHVRHEGGLGSILKLQELEGGSGFLKGRLGLRAEGAPRLREHHHRITGDELLDMLPGASHGCGCPGTATQLAQTISHAATIIT